MRQFIDRAVRNRAVTLFFAMILLALIADVASAIRYRCRTTADCPPGGTTRDKTYFCDHTDNYACAGPGICRLSRFFPRYPGDWFCSDCRQTLIQSPYEGVEQVWGGACTDAAYACNLCEAGYRPELLCNDRQGPPLQRGNCVAGFDSGPTRIVCVAVEIKCLLRCDPATETAYDNPTDGCPDRCLPGVQADDCDRFTDCCSEPELDMNGCWQCPEL